MLPKSLAAADQTGNTPLIWAAEHGQLDAIKFLLDSPLVDVDAKGHLGATAISRASRRGHASALRALAPRATSIDEPNDKLQYPLHFAAFKRKPATVRALLEHGASTTVRDRKGRTPAEDTDVAYLREAILAVRAGRDPCELAWPREDVAFCPKGHLAVESVYGPGLRRYRIGLTERGLEEIGDVLEVRVLAHVGERVQASAGLLQVDWSAMRISDGDELYHTKWANIEGEHVLRAPCAGTVTALGGAASDVASALVSSRWLVELRCATAADSEALDDALLCEMRYADACRASKPGRFGESEDALGYSSYG
jgi:glycine cleavage system H lipoate-binding protein